AHSSVGDMRNQRAGGQGAAAWLEVEGQGVDDVAWAGKRGRRAWESANEPQRSKPAGACAAAAKKAAGTGPAVFHDGTAGRISPPRPAPSPPAPAAPGRPPS